MNATQKEEWDKFSCMSRALLKAAAIKQISITEDEFRTRYDCMFLKGQYGCLILSTFVRIASHMGLAKEMDLLWHLHDVKKLFDQGFLVIVFSGIHLLPGRTDEFSHASVLLTIDADTFDVDGVTGLKHDDWVKKRCCGIVFYA